MKITWKVKYLINDLRKWINLKMKKKFNFKKE